MNHTTRPNQIDKILDKLDTQFPDEMGATLENYISNLETHQAVDEDTFVWDVDNPPMWSHARQEKRAQHRRERAARNRKAYQ